MSRSKGSPFVNAASRLTNTTSDTSQFDTLFESERLKVNDLAGNPIEIAAVVVWRVVDTAEAAFHVDNYDNFVHVQSESALRNMALLDNEKKAAMVSNLLVVLCSDRSTQPIISAGKSG